MKKLNRTDPRLFQEECLAVWIYDRKQRGAISASAIELNALLAKLTFRNENWWGMKLRNVASALGHGTPSANESTLARIRKAEDLRVQHPADAVAKSMGAFKALPTREEFATIFSGSVDYESNVKRIVKFDSTLVSKINVEQAKSEPKALINHVHAYIEGKGYHFKREEVANFYLALRTKPFVILAGISGTGKTQLPSLFAEAVGMSDDQVSQIAVRPDWTDGSDLIGYVGLNEDFKPRDLTIAILRAKEDPTKPHFFILDEMNLARVEHYFSDFLSVIESRKRRDGHIVTRPMIREESIASATNRNKFEGLTWPENLYLIGTVNMDETTHAFSRKVLDRANAIEMNDVDLNWPEEGAKVDAWSGIHNDALRTEYLIANELSTEDRALLDSKGVMAFMERVNEILKKADLHFAYRVRDEMAFYLLLNLRSGLMEHEEAIDFQLMQKVLPRIHGSSGRTERVLLDLLNLLAEIETAGTDHKTDDLEEKVKEKRKESGNERYKRSVDKILFMLRRFEEDRFTSFWL
jgi:hypothetical protein